MLCAATEEILWPDVSQWSPAEPAGHRLECRVGRGEATYYRALGHRRHRLTFGWKMIASKHDPVLASQGLTGREMLQKGYFSGQFTLAALLAHTCCHEFAHLVQGLNGWMARGSIHNAQFYHVLDSLYAAGAGERVLDSIEQKVQMQGWSLAFAEDTILTHSEVQQFRMGQLVSFEYRGASVMGEVIRVNRKTVNVKPLKSRSTADYFRISPHYLTCCAEPA